MTTLQQQARALGDPTRHKVFRYVAEADHPVDVAELTEHFGLNHNAIRQHLAKLVAADLVTEATAPSQGPGRPRLTYVIDAAAESRWGVTGPYERLSMLLAEIIRTGDSPVEVGRRQGRRDAELRPRPADDEGVVEAVREAIAREGFEPEVRRTGDEVDIVLRNCPFETTAVADPDTICALHLGLAQGLADSAADVVVDELVARDPRHHDCLLRLRVEPAAAPGDAGGRLRGRAGD
ncbi:MAG TPA: helix-turn-helix domain-containing protein [Acidimicrobiales bacterium]|nr:helix-turn-helix domain-containing protein [Acidimicrobiales bacterium]